MILTLHTEGWFDAAHSLKNYEGKCSNEHGHTYKLEVTVKGDEVHLLKNGILWDFGNVKAIIDMFDHKNLDYIYEENSTAENQCLYIYKKFKKESPHLQFKVRLYEQLAPKKSYCECGDFE